MWAESLFLPFHPEQETEKDESFNQPFIYHHDGDERGGAENEIFRQNCRIPAEKEKSETDDDSLVKDIEGQNRLVGIFRQPIPEVEMPASDPQNRQNPHPGIEGPKEREPKIVETAEGGVDAGAPDIKSHNGRYRGQGQENCPLFLYGSLISLIRCQKIPVQEKNQIDENVPSPKISLSESVGMEEKFHEGQRKHPQQNRSGLFEKRRQSVEQ